MQRDNFRPAAIFVFKGASAAKHSRDISKQLFIKSSVCQVFISLRLYEAGLARRESIFFNRRSCLYVA
jgi:hypothetical protein